MKLIDYLNSLAPDARDAFASKCGTSVGYIRKACSVGQSLGAELCVSVEQHSDGQVTRQELRPDDWERIWPELVDAA